MTEVVNPSDVELATMEQFGRICDSLTALLRKKNLPRRPTQQVIEHMLKPLTAECAALVQKRVELMSRIIIRRVKVDRTRSPEEVVNATDRTQYVNKDVLATMPKGEGDEVDVWFVPTEGRVPVSETLAFLAQYGLVPDPRAQAAVNEEDPSFADQHPNGTQWGDNCYLAFGGGRHGKRGVDCDRFDDGWLGIWWLEGVPASRK